MVTLASLGRTHNSQGRRLRAEVATQEAEQLTAVSPA